MPGPVLAHQKRHQMRDVTVMSCTGFSGGTAGTTIAFIALAETCTIKPPKRMYGDTTSSADTVESSRPLRWGTGSVTLVGFSDYDANQFTAIFVQGAYATFQFTSSTTGESWQLLCRCEDLDIALGKDQTKNTLTLTVEGAPFYAASGSTLAIVSLD
ncbi:hypothetical protein CCAX7_54580 [Capsulimonas corticalis]|uniref:Uncharacterized protein n=1 Tax=Capsulimonas corticalis TaxID=2219043 RepID=A0A402D5U0_9BACT|nr:hypothetical protein [Capsulimonas corticalis]BDI33407.1 hypothetical protein CCAX7_54580 [Capsulimonas corticalis]